MVLVFPDILRGRRGLQGFPQASSHLVHTREVRKEGRYYLCLEMRDLKPRRVRWIASLRWSQNYNPDLIPKTPRGRTPSRGAPEGRVPWRACIPEPCPRPTVSAHLGVGESAQFLETPQGIVMDTKV